MILDMHSIEAAAGGNALLVLSGSFTLDESWSPYGQATLVCSLAAAWSHIASLDPRTGARVSGLLQRDFGDAWTNADMTAAFPIPATNADMTAAYPGWTNAQITARFFRAWNSFGVRDSDIRPFDLAVRGRVIDHVAQTVTVTLATDEAVLQDKGLVAAAKYINTQTSLRDLVSYVLAQIGAQLQGGTFDAVIVAGALSWLPGVDGYSYLQSPIDAAGGRLWCDENRRWYLTVRTPLTSGNLALSTGDAGSITTSRDTIDRDGDWYDAVVLTYTWTDGAGATQYAYDIAGNPLTSVRVLAQTINATFPGMGAAAALLDRSQGRGRVLELAAVSDYRGSPGQSFTADLPDTDLQSGVVSAITWHFPDAEMDVTTRGLIDIASTAWIFDPAGLSWSSLAVGIDWTEDI